MSSQVTIVKPKTHSKDAALSALTIELKSSRYLLLYWIAVLLLSTVFVVLSGLLLIIKIVFIIGFAYVLFTQYSNYHSSLIRALKWDGSRWRLIMNTGEILFVDLQDNRWVTSHLIFLVFDRNTGESSVIKRMIRSTALPLCLFRDSMHARDWRKLQILLRYGKT